MPHPFCVAFATLALASACAESPLAPAASTDAAASAIDPVAAMNPSATFAVATCAGATTRLTGDEKRTLDLHNAQRASSGLPAFCVDPTLTTAARAHASDMLAKGYFSHTSASGVAFGARLQGFGYTPYSALAENIAWGSGGAGAPDPTFTNWMNSAGHRTNIMNGALREIGVGVASGTYQGYAGARMYTVDFGTR